MSKEALWDTFVELIFGDTANLIIECFDHQIVLSGDDLVDSIVVISRFKDREDLLYEGGNWKKAFQALRTGEMVNDDE